MFIISTQTKKKKFGCLWEKKKNRKEKTKKRKAIMLPEEIVCGLSLMIALAARSNCIVSCKFGHVAVVFGNTVAGNGVHGVLELLLLLLCSDIFETYVRIIIKKKKCILIREYVNNLLISLLLSNQSITCGTLKEDGGRGYKVSWEVNPESWLHTEV